MAELCKDGFLIQSLRKSDFDCYSAYGEVIDNSTQAKAKNIKIEFDVISRGTGKNQKEIIDRIAFGDDGIGMNEQVLENCLTLGWSSRYNDRNGIGRFGVGATLAALHECTHIKVFSKTSQTDWHSVLVEVAIDKNGQPDPENQKEISKPIKEAIPKEFEKLVGKDSGTLVVWSNNDTNDINATEVIEETKIWCGRTYRKLIWKNLDIYINGEKVDAIDPLYVETKKTKFPEDPKAYEYSTCKISWPIEEAQSNKKESDIIIRTSLLPIEFRYKRFLGGSEESKKRYIDRNEGISILRNDREVFYGIPPNWPRGGVSFSDNTDKNRWWGCEISFHAEIDKSFVVKNIKRGAIPTLTLRHAINDKIKGMINQALETVNDDWAKHDQKVVEEKKKDNTATGHEDAEKIAKNTSVQKNILTKDKDPKQLTQEAAENLLTDQQKQMRAQWETKFEAQPFTIIDNSWKGSEFVQVGHTAKGAVLSYNNRHPFHAELLKIKETIEKNNPEETYKAAKKLNSLIDLLLISYCKSELAFDNDNEMSPEELVEDLRINWGRFLERYLKKINENG